MASAQYVVEKGDTLSGIAKKLGVSTSNLTGFRSGNADLIYPGEVLSIKSPTNSQATERASTIRTELGGSETGSTRTNTGGAPALDDTEKTSGGFNVETLRSNVEDAKKKRDEAYKKLDGFRTNRYDELVSERALNDRKDEIASLDDQIAEKKRIRDESINKIRSNPGASAATLSGEVARATDKLNADINNLIDQRNSVAGEYNTELAEIERLVENEAKDIEASFGFFDSSVDEAQSLYDAYQKAIVDELTRQEERDQSIEDDLRDFEQALELARISKSGSGSGVNYTILTDQFGRPTVAIDRSNPTNQVDLSGAEGSTNVGGTPAALLQAQAQAQNESNEPGLWSRFTNWLGF